MAGILDRIGSALGDRLGRYLSQPIGIGGTSTPTDPHKLIACLEPGDVLLVEGRTRVSVAIKYLTQSTWSHAALYVGDATGLRDDRGAPRCFIEADIRAGVRAVGVAEYAGLHCRVCRPVGLPAPDIDALIEFLLVRLGHRYDLKNVIDLARYLLPTPPVPVRWRRRMLALGSGDPTRAISLFVPRDFDVSPYFSVVKPGLDAGFDPRSLSWHEVGALSNTDVAHGTTPASFA